MHNNANLNNRAVMRALVIHKNTEHVSCSISSLMPDIIFVDASFQ